MYTYVIIDDEQLIRKGTIKKLQPMCDTVSCIGEAEDGLSGISMIEEKNPDFVILDMQMPGMDGTKLLPYLAEHYPQMPLIVISGFRDFDYIKHAITANAIDYLLKPFSKEALRKCVQNAIERLELSQSISRQITDSYEQKEAACYEYDLQYLTNLIMGYHTGEASISSEKLKFINDTHRMLLLTMHFEGPADKFPIQQWLEDGSFGDLALYLSSPTAPQTGFLIIFFPNEEAISSINLVHQITDSLLVHARQLTLPLQIGISRTHGDLRDLHTAFKETSEALNQQKLSADSLYCAYAYRQAEKPRTVVWEREDEFLFRLEAGMTEEIAALTDKLFSWFLSMSDFTLMDAKYYCYQLSNHCREILNRYLNDGSDTPSRSIQNIVSQIFRLSELKNYYLQFFQNMAEMLKSESIYALDDTVEKIKLYMQNNYHKNITQDFIASLFYLNRSYLSTVFRQKTGTKFIDYLNEVRIEKAKEMLSGSNRKIYQISKLVGYDNPKYFFRIFKKMTRMTPDQYRQKTQTSIS